MICVILIIDGMLSSRERVYSRRVPEWLKYMEYMQLTFPYLFSLGLRKNPFNEHARVVVEK